jgi:hypothetical protein
MLHLRPHHLIDIIRNIGQGRPVIPHAYGHAQHTITWAMMEGEINEIRLTIGSDDLCQPCIHLSPEGLCKDILPQLEYTLGKQQYNDELDRQVLAFLCLEDGAVIRLADFLNLMEDQLEELTAICLHPKEILEKRKAGMINGVAFLRKMNSRRSF